MKDMHELEMYKLKSLREKESEKIELLRTVLFVK